MKEKYLKNLLLLAFIISASQIQAQSYSVKTNVLGLATSNLNVELSMALSRRVSIHLPVTYNPFVFSNNRKMQNLTFQPAVRYWFLESYARRFIGVSAIASTYHISGKKYRYEGKGYGIGLSYGYSMLLSPHWNLEFEGGIGAVRADYTKYTCKKCGKKLGEEQKWYVLPTKLSVSIVYLF